MLFYVLHLDDKQYAIKHKFFYLNEIRAVRFCVSDKKMMKSRLETKCHHFYSCSFADDTDLPFKESIDMVQKTVS